MIGPLMRVAASAAAARTLRVAAHEAAIRVVMTIAAGLAVGVGAVCLTCSAFILLARTLDPAGAWAIIGAVWGGAGLAYFVAARRRRS
jgi:hypothetical protein